MFAALQWRGQGLSIAGFRGALVSETTKGELGARAASYFGAMPEGLHAEMSNFARLFMLGAIYMIPRFQRPYSWTSEHVSKLIQDLRRAALRNGFYYFIGDIVLVRKDGVEWQIADGQQRLATMTMIFAYIRERLGEAADLFQHLILTPDGRARVRLRQQDADFYHTYVQTPGRFFELSGLEDSDTAAQGALATAARTICDGLADMSDDELEAFGKFIVQGALFDVVRAESAGGAALIFATVNDRGLELSFADLTKSALIERAPMSEAAKDAAMDVWEELEEEIGQKRFIALLEMAPTLMSGEPILAAGDLSVFLDDIETRVGLDKFLTDWLPRHGRALSAIHNLTAGGPHAGEINRRLHCLSQLKETNWLPLAVAALVRFDERDERRRLFFQRLDLMAFSCVLGPVRPEVRDKRWKQALADLGDERKLFDPANGHMSLRDGEVRALIERLGKPFAKDGSQGADLRKLIMIWINACLAPDELLSRDDADLSLEHVLPVKGGPAWEKLYTPADRKIYAQLMGNWTLASKAQNKSCGVKLYDEKKPILLDPTYPTYAVTRTLRDYKSWTKLDIELRREKFQIALFKDWGLA